MNYQQYPQPVGTCLKCHQLVYPPNFVAYPTGPVHSQCAQNSQIASAQRSSSIPIWAIAMGAMFMLGGGCLVLLSAAGNSAANAPPDIQVEAKDLYEVYRTNEVRADSLYKGKRVAVRGIAGDVQKTVFDDVYIEVRSGVGLDLNSLWCYAKSGQEKAFGEVRAGYPVRLSARIDGLTLGHIMGRDCVVMK
ncbi:MAG: hypothetical protein IPM54_25130 [Polyangiaceae bacterium]|nr:hypothetical protein [Polyangiaceae bacterium]